MNRVAKASVVPALAATIALTGCGNSTKAGSAASSAMSTTTATSTTGATGTASSATSAASQCPTSNTRSFAKTRFVGDVGLVAGSFHRYIYKPYQAGSFQKGADGRTKAIAKAGITAAADAKLVNNAYDNVQANPTLCKVLITPLGQLKDAMGGLKGQITSGNLGAIANVNGLVNQVTSKSNANGAQITEKSN